MSVGPVLKSRVIDALEHRESDAVPYNCNVSLTPDMKEALDRHYGGREGWPPVRDHARRILWTEFVDEDEKYYYDPFGIAWRKGNPARIDDPPLKQPTLKGINWPEYIPDWHCEDVVQQTEDHKDKFVYYQFVGCFWERAWYLRGFDTWLMDLYVNRDFAEDLMDALVDHLLPAVDRILELPVDGIVFGDDFGTQRGLMVNPDLWREIVKPRLARIYRKVTDAGRYLGIHSCGNVTDILNDYIELGVQFFHPFQEEAMDIARAKEAVGNRITFRGGIGVQHVLPRGTPDDVRRYVRDLAKILAPGGGWIMEAGKPLGMETPVENAAALLETMLEVSESSYPTFPA